MSAIQSSAIEGSGFRTASAAEIAQLVGAQLTGDGSRVVNAISTLDRADGQALSWLGDALRASMLVGTKAGILLLPQGVAGPDTAVLLHVDDPDLALNRVLAWMGPSVPEVATGIDPTAIVARTARVEGASIGPRVVVGDRSRIAARTQVHAGVVIGPDVSIGADCLIWPNVVIRERVRIGDRVIIHPNCTIGADGFGYLFREGRHVRVPQVGTVSIEDDVEIGANCAVDRAKSGVTRIGRGTKIDNLVQIGHNCDIGEHCMIVAQCGLSGTTRLGHHVVLGGQVGIADHVTLAPGTQVAAKSGVIGDLEAGRYSGIPAFEARAYWKYIAAGRRLPELVEQVKDLARRIERIERPEPPADDQARS